MNPETSKYSAQYFLDKAHQSSGLSDYGQSGFLPSFEKLVYSLREEARLTVAGWEVMEGRLVRLLSNRLRFEDELKKHPEILEQELLPALVMVGLPRTGSTKLQRMVAASRAFQELIMWQAYNPAPFPGSAESDFEERLEDAAKFCEWRASTNPATDAAHHVAAAQIEEETYLLEFTFDSIFPVSSTHVPSYIEFLKTRDMSEQYSYLRKLLQYIQWQFHQGDVKPWILKSPMNLGFEKFICREIPGCRFLVSHRDPTVSIVSLAAFIGQNRLLYSDWVDRKSISEWVLDEFSSEMERHMAWRKAMPDVPVLDLSFRDIVDNGMDVASRVHEFIGIPLSAEAEQSIADWLEENSRHKHGKHEYSLESVGLTADQIRQKFSAYMTRYAEYL